MLNNEPRGLRAILADCLLVRPATFVDDLSQPLCIPDVHCFHAWNIAAPKFRRNQPVLDELASRRRALRSVLHEGHHSTFTKSIIRLFVPGKQAYRRMGFRRSASKSVYGGSRMLPLQAGSRKRRRPRLLEYDGGRSHPGSFRRFARRLGPAARDRRFLRRSADLRPGAYDLSNTVSRTEPLKPKSRTKNNAVGRKRENDQMADETPRSKAGPAPKLDRVKQLARVRRICMWIPGTSERISHGEPTFFTPKRVFAMFADNHHRDGRVAVWLPAAPGVQTTLMEEAPGIYFRPLYIGVSGWVYVELKSTAARQSKATQTAQAERRVPRQARKPRLMHLPHHCNAPPPRSFEIRCSKTTSLAICLAAHSQNTTEGECNAT
jgi:hypothetical protein